MGVMKSKVYKKTKAFSKLAKVAQSFHLLFIALLQKEKKRVDLHKPVRETLHIIYPP